MLNELYSERILAAAAAIPAARRLPSPDASARKVSRVCGSELTIDLALSDGRIVDVGLEAKACALGQASASIFARNVIGARPEEICALRDAMRAMLKADGPAPSGERWHELESLNAIRAYPQRHASTLLVFEAACEALARAGFGDESKQ